MKNKFTILCFLCLILTSCGWIPPPEPELGMTLEELKKCFEYPPDSIKETPAGSGKLKVCFINKCFIFYKGILIEM